LHPKKVWNPSSFPASPPVLVTLDAASIDRLGALQNRVARAGESAEVHIGVAKDSARGFEAHAWLEHRGAILVGDNGELARYAPILAVSGEKV